MAADLDRLNFSEPENRRLCADIEAAGGSSLRDMRVRPGGSHHQKFVVLRHPGRAELDVAFVSGIDLCHGRHDDATHAGDGQAVTPNSAVRSWMRHSTCASRTYRGDAGNTPAPMRGTCA